MGSYGQDVFNSCVSVHIDKIPSDGHLGISAIEVLELCWVITTWVYQCDNIIEVVQCNYDRQATKHGQNDISMLTNIYRVDKDMTARDIVKAKETQPQLVERYHGRGLEALDGGKTNSAILLLDQEHDMSQFTKQNLGLTYRKLILWTSICGETIRSAVISSNDEQSCNYALHVADTFEQVCLSISMNSTLTIGRMQMIGAEHRNKILKTTKKPIEWAHSFLGARLAQAAADYPDAVAINAWDGDLTYAEFYRLAHCFAAFLIDQDVSIEERIPIYMKKSKLIPVVVIGIMIAGATCVPLDTRFPSSRLEELVKRLGSRYVLTDGSETFRFEEMNATVFNCSEISRQPQKSNNKWPEVNPKTAALVFFTSGSTGIPKGVVWEHGALYATLSHLSEAFVMERDSRILQYASYTFDASVGDMFGPMFVGACVCIPSEEQRMDSVSNFARDAKVTHACLTNTVIGQIQPEHVPTLQYLFAGGEPLDKVQLHRWQDRLNLCVVYGTTESLIWDTIARRDDLIVQHNNIGFSFGPSLWIVDTNDVNVLKPTGAVGEILLEGPTLARGYMEPEVSSSPRFIEAPSWLQQYRGRDRVRCYRTGDIGYRNSDGSVAVLGRADTQVKIRGQRVELGEIEHNLRLISAPSDQIVVEAVLLEGRGTAKTLASFYIKPNSASHHVGILPMEQSYQQDFKSYQQLLSEVLPPHMIPPFFFPIQSLPRTSAGKADRKVLRQWASELHPEELAQYLLRDMNNLKTPETVCELMLQQFWAKVLRIPKSCIGADNHYFQLGGDSLKAIELVTALREVDKSIGVAQIFQHPRLCDMAKLLKDLEDQEGQKPAPAPFDSIPATMSAEACLREVATICQIGRELIEDVYPATPMQEALMAITARRPHTYQCRMVFKIPTSLDQERFKAAWDCVAMEQSVLRTRIVICGEAGAIQAILRSRLAWYTAPALVDYARYEKENPLAYGTALTRYAIVGRGAASYFVWNCHHAIYDAWSQPRILNEVQRAYRDLDVSQQIPYVHFVHYLVKSRSNEAETFWKEQFPTVSEMFPSSPSAQYQPKAETSMIASMKINRRVGSGVTTATVIQAAWALVTARQAGSDNAIFGLTLSGRDAPLAKITDMLGPTITTVPVSINIDNLQSIRDYLQDVQDQISRLKSHQHTGIQRIRRFSSETQSAANIQNLLVIHPADHEPSQYLSELGLKLTTYEETDCLDRILTLQCTTKSNAINVKAIYDETIIPSQQMDLLLCRLEHVISQLVTESSEKTIYNIELVSPSDIQQMSAWNRTMPPTVEATIHELVERQVRANPNSIAIAGFDMQLTYAELDSMANSLAARLFSKGVKPEVRVVLCFAKSTWPIIAMLAVLKSGGVCVSVNPDHPMARLLEICTDVEATMLLCDDKNVEKFSAHVPEVMAISSQMLPQLSPQSKVLSRATPSNGAFVIYTSGSTGKPKGSLLEHCSLSTSLTAIGSKSGMTSEARTLQFSAYTFDAHVLEIFGTLIHGGCVCVISDHERMNDIEQAIRDRRVNWSLLTPTVARMLQPLNVPTLKTLILSGEPLAKQDIRQWANHLKLLNGLGPSECSILACITGQVGLDGNPANIGHALGCHLWITDHRRPNRLAPVGCVGELLVEGPIVGRYYVNRPKATTAAFVTDLDWSRNGSDRERRFYRTGDLAKFDLDGSIIFVGRADSQVKIRGQRVEPGEIENTLRTCGLSGPIAVEVLTIPSRGKIKALAAFVTSSPAPGEHVEGSLLNMNESRRETFREAQKKLSTMLPQYMIPSMFFPIQKLPISPSGKLEHKTLQSLVTKLSGEQLALYHLVEPLSSQPLSTENEKKLHQLWVRILRVPETTVGANDNFFQLGGDSVMAMEMIAIARGRGLSLTVTDIFRYPKLQDMAEKLGILEAIGSEDKTIEPFSLIQDRVSVSQCVSTAVENCQVEEDFIEDIYPCSALQEALMAVTARLPRTYTHQAVYIIPSSLDLNRFKRAWEALVAAHAIFRTRIIVMAGIGAVQVVLRPDVQWRTGTSLTSYLEEDRLRPMTYGDNLTRWALIEENDGVKFVWTVHHALYDGWSLPRILNEVRNSYESGSSPTPVPYNRFIQYATGIASQASDDFWRSQFPTVSESYPQLPSTEYTPRPSRKQAIVMKLARPAGFVTTMATVVQAAYALVVAQHAAANEATFGVTLSGRDAPVAGITDMLGPTITTIPMRIQINPTQTLREYLAMVQDQVVLVRRYQHAGLQHIRRLSPEASVAVKFQNLLVVQTIGDDQINSSLEPLGLQSIPQIEDEFLNLALTTEVVIRSDGVHMSMQYDKSIIATDQVTCLLYQVEQAAIELLNSPSNTLLNEIKLLSAHDLQQLATWNMSEPRAIEATVDGLFEDQVVKRPDAIATTGFDGQFTYAELDMLAGTLAVWLTAQGVGPEVPVVLCFAKSTWAIISMLAVLKAGGVCASINPDHPLPRQLDICEDLQAKVLLCDANSEARFLGHLEKVMAVNGSTLSQLEPSKLHWDPPKAAPSDPAFIVFTSGSTGKPKGSILEHRSMCTSILLNCEATGMGVHTRTLQSTAYTFDVHILEIFGTLLHGGCICVMSDEQRSDLAGTIRSLQANRCFFTPTVAHLFKPAEVPTLKTITIGGEPVTKKNLETWADHVELFNTWGPSETCVGSSIGRLTTKSNPNNIGRPLGCRLWIVDSRNIDRLAPIGCIGELIIEGPIVGRGYINRPDATAASFITDPKWSRDILESQISRRFYRTGDLAKFDETGSVVFIGRLDTQVKIRGQRVELGEIEYHLKLSGLVSSSLAVDVIKVSGRGDAQVLTAFVKCVPTDTEKGPILNMNPSLTTVFQAAQQKLAAILPRYMVPSMFLPVSELPLMPSGKLDRRVLRQWALHISGEQDRATQYYLAGNTKPQPLSTDNERILQDLWMERLRLSKNDFGANDNFFQLGGDSITAMEIIAAARELGLSLSTTDVFRHPRLQDMALALKPVRHVEEVVKPFGLICDKGDPEQFIRLAADQCHVNTSMIEDMYPCSALQEALMAITARSPQTYTHRGVYKVPRSLDIGRFKTAWEALVGRHHILRTRILVLPELGATQVVLRSNITWYSGSSVKTYLEQDRARSVVYGDEICRWALIKDTALDEVHFIWTIHHATYDGWTLPRLFDEVRRDYEAASSSSVEGRPSGPIVPYNRFIHHITTINEEDSDKFWRNQFPAITETYPRLPNVNYVPQPLQKQSLEVPLTRPSHIKITNTVATLIQGAWALVTARHAGANEALFGVTLSGRDTPVAGITDIMGPTIGTVPMRISIDPTQTISEFLTTVQNQLVLVRTYQHAGLQRIRQLSPAAKAAVDFQNLLVIQTTSDRLADASLEMLGLQPASSSEREQGFLNLALNIEAVIHVDSVQITMQYDEHVIVSGQVTCLLHQLQQAIHQLMDRSDDTQLDDLDLLSVHDARQLTDWNVGEIKAVEAAIHELVEAQVRARPHAIATTGLEGDYTYAELDRMANSLADHLAAACGVGPEVLVVLCFEKSVWAIISMLAVLKSGGGCVSVNADDPINRIHEIYQDAGATVLLCSTSIKARFSGHIAAVTAIDSNMISQLRTPRDQTRPVAKPDHTAFVVYSSGSTGKPKGSMLEHRSLCTSLLAEVNINAETRSLQFASYTFDIHILEIFGTLIKGGCICIISNHQRMNDLAGAINDLKVNWMWLTSTVASLLSPSAVPSVRTLLLGGEPLIDRVVKTWVPFVRVITTYGPSECSIHASMNFKITSDSDCRNLGYGVGCHFWVCERDRIDRLVPIGCVGELVIEGPIVARSYINRPAEAAEAFVTSPAWAQTTLNHPRRFYRTGDLVRHEPDGTVQYVGRADTQVKIHGQRVELGEIEYNVVRALSSTAQRRGYFDSDSFGQVVVEPIQPKKKPGPVLAAFVHLKPKLAEQLQDLEDDLREMVLDLEEELSEAIPRYMIPSVYLPLAEVPLLLSGKTDRGAIREIGQSLTTEQIDGSRPQPASSQRPWTESERLIQRVWVAVLGVQADVIDLHHNFFHLGGDSVMAMKVVGALHAYGFSITVANIFRHPRVSEMASVMVKCVPVAKSEAKAFAMLGVRDERNFLDSQVLPYLRYPADEVVDVLPLFYFQRIAVEKNLLNPPQHMNYWFIDLPRSVDGARIEDICNKLVDEFEILRTIFVKSDNEFLQVVLRTLRPGFLHCSSDEDVHLSSEQLCVDDLKKPVALGESWSRFWLLRGSSKNSRLVIRLSHAQYDGISLGILTSAFTAFYDGRNLPEYRGFSSYISHLVNHNHQSYPHWRSLLEGSQMTILPPRPTLTSVEQSKNLRFSKTISQLPDNLKATPATIFTTACALALCNVTNSQDVVIGRLVSGRAGLAADSQTAVGPCMNIIPVRVRSKPDQDLGTILRSVQTQYIESTAHETTGLDEIVRECTDWPDSTTHFRTISQYQNIDETHVMRTIDFTTQLSYYWNENAQAWLESVYMLGTPVKEGLRVMVGASTRYYDDHVVERLHAELCKVLDLLVRSH